MTCKMSAPSAKEILKNLGPKKSNERYETAWINFKSFLANEKEGHCSEVTSPKALDEDDFRGLHSILPSLEGRKEIPIVQPVVILLMFELLLKQYESGYVRKSKALQLNETSSQWIMSKAAIALAYCRGLRCYAGSKHC